MKRKLILILTAILFLTVSCSANNDTDAWKNNTGTINLDKMEVSGNGITVSDNTVSISSGGNFDVTGTLEDGMIYIKSEEKVQLRLSGMSITNTSGPAIFFDNAEKAFITITEGTENYLADGKEYTTDDANATLFSNDDLEIKGDGTLTIEANYKHGIAGDDDVKIENGNIYIKSFEHGIKVNDTLSILGGDINIEAETGKGIKAELELIIENGNININALDNEGMESKGTMLIDGGNINITAKEDGINTGNPDTATDTSATIPENTSPENIKPPADGMQRGGKRGSMKKNPPLMPDGEAPPFERGNRQPREIPEGDKAARPQGQMPAGRGGFMHIDEETAKAHSITINGGNIYIDAACDGIDSNGHLTINGGVITINAPENSGNGPLDCDGTMSITGGEVSILSSQGMIQLPPSKDINILRVTFEKDGSKDDVITVKDAEDNVIATHTAIKNYSVFIYSSNKILKDTSYSIYVNDTLYKTVTTTEGITTIGESGFMGSRGNKMQGFKNENRQKENNQISVNLNGQNLRFNTNPIIKNGTTLVAFRTILEALGATVSWDDETKTVTAEKGDVKICLTIGNDTAKVNDEDKKLLVAPEIINDTTMIPIRFVSENLNMDVLWDDNLKLITINSK